MPDADVTLVQPPAWSVALPPLGLAYLSRFVRAFGFRARVLDLNIEFYRETPVELRHLWGLEAIKLWASEKAVLGSPGGFEGMAERWLPRILEDRAPLVGFSCTIGSIGLVRILARKIREVAPEQRIVVGGPGIFFEEHRRYFPPELIDGFVVGEGEEALLDLLRCAGSEDWYGIPGYLPNGRPGAVTPHRAVCRHIDDIPFPDFTEFDLSRYTSSQLPIIMSRGCVNRCSFCNDHRQYPKFRFRDPVAVVDEVEAHHNRYAVKWLHFNDLLVNGSPRMLRRFAEEMQGRKLYVDWTGQAAVRKEMDAELFRELRNTGLKTLTFGCESFSDRVLKLMRKRFTRAESARCLKVANAAGVETQVNIIVGFPGETEEDHQETLSFLREHRSLLSGIGSMNTCSPTVGSAIYENPAEYGVVTEDDDLDQWRTSDGLNTPEVRGRRLGEVQDLVEDLGLAVFASNAAVGDGEGACQEEPRS